MSMQQAIDINRLKQELAEIRARLTVLELSRGKPGRPKKEEAPVG